MSSTRFLLSSEVHACTAVHATNMLMKSTPCHFIYIFLLQPKKPQVRNGKPLHGVLLGIHRRSLPKGHVGLLGQERCPDLLHLPAGRHLLRPRPLPKRHHLRVRIHLWPGRHAKGDHGTRSNFVRDRCHANLKVHGRHRHRSRFRSRSRHFGRGLGENPFRRL